MNKHKSFAIAAIAVAAIAGPAQAARYQGTITNVTPYGTRVFISIGSGGFDGGGSTCYSSPTAMIYSFDGTTAQGKALLATVLSAKLTDKVVYVYGDATCPAGGNPYNGQGSENMMGIDLKG